MKFSTRVTRYEILFFSGLFFISALSACNGGGFQASTLADSSNQAINNGQSTSASPVSAFSKIDMEGYVSGGTYDSNFAVNLDKVNNTLIVNAPIPAGPFTNLYVDVPNLNGAKIKTYYDSNNLPQVSVSIPLKYILHGGTLLQSATLPNGNPLPAMPSGEAPSLAFSLNQSAENKLYIYIGVNAVGLYIENSYIPSYLGMTFPVKNKAQTQVLGYFTIVPKISNFNGGIFVSVPLSNTLAKIIDDHLSGLIQ